MSDSIIFQNKTFNICGGLSYSDKIQYCSNYQDFVSLLNPSIDWFFLDQTHDYQGDWLCIGYKKGKYYLKQGYYGSCSGCDWLESIEDKEDALKFLKEMCNIICIGNKKQAIIYLTKELNNAWSEVKDLLLDAVSKLASYNQKEKKLKGLGSEK
jgi:hypothetical protein